MRVRIVKQPPATASEGQPGTREFVLEVAQLTIGRDSSQDLQLADMSVALRHAVIRARARKLRISACTGNTLEVNGVRRSTADLAAGDIVRIGSATIRLLEAYQDASATLEIEENPGTRRHDRAATHPASLREAGLSARASSWIAALGITAILLIPPLLTALYAPARLLMRSAAPLPSDRLWLAGPLHESHRFIDDNCNACHAAPFRRVANAQCTACHRGVQHHVNIHSADVALFPQRRCGGCHIEHGEPSTLVPRDSRLCTECHSRLRSLKPDTTLADVADFGNRHPDFHLTLLQRVPAAGTTKWRAMRTPGGASRPPEHSGLAFSHAAHMKAEGIESPRGYEVLTCNDCHRPNTSGRQMLPIRMETHCARCHSLLFDEHDVTSAVPHGSLPRVFETLQAHFIRKYLDSSAAGGAPSTRRPGGETDVMTRDEQRRARGWADREALLIAGELLEKRVCIQCHRVTHISGAAGFAQWQIDPVRIARDWMPLAQFSHARHATTACQGCHSEAARSKSSADVLMPSITTCRQCHGGADDASRLPSDCGMCHGFHLPGRGLFEAAAARRKP